MNDPKRLSNFRISDTRIFEVSAWFRSIIQRIKYSKRRLILQDRWFELVEQYLYQNNISTLNSSFTLYTSRRNAFEKRKLWIYFSQSLIAKYRLEQLEYFYLNLRNYLISQFQNSNWVHITRKLIHTKRKEEIRRVFNSYSFSLDKWNYFYTNLILHSKKNQFGEAFQQLQEQKRSFSESQMSLRSLKLNQSQNQLSDTQIEIPMFTRQTQTIFPNTETTPYKNFMKLVRHYINQKYYEKFIDIHDDFLKKQKEKKIRRHKQAQSNWIDLSSRYKKFAQAEELEYSADELKKYTKAWKTFYSLLRSNHLHSECEKGQYYLDKTYHEMSKAWKSMISNMLLADKKKNCQKMLQNYREKQLKKATEFSVSFIDSKIGGIDEIVSQHYKFKPDHYQKALPKDFWHTASQFAFSFARDCFVESVNQALPLLTTESSQLAKDFVDCQSLLAISADCQKYKNQTSIKSEKRVLNTQTQKNVHIIIGFGYNDTVSLLDSVDLPNS